MWLHLWQKKEVSDSKIDIRVDNNQELRIMICLCGILAMSRKRATYSHSYSTRADIMTGTLCNRPCGDIIGCLVTIGTLIGNVPQKFTGIFFNTSEVTTYDGIEICILLFFLNPRKTRVGRKLKKLRKNGEANVPSGRPTQNCCATKQNWNEITKQKCVETKTRFPCRLQTREIFRPRLPRNLRASQFMGPSDSTAMGWKMYWSSSVLYFATLWVAAILATAPTENIIVIQPPRMPPNQGSGPSTFIIAV